MADKLDILQRSNRDAFKTPIDNTPQEAPSPLVPRNQAGSDRADKLILSNKYPDTLDQLNAMKRKISPEAEK